MSNFDRKDDHVREEPLPIGEPHEKISQRHEADGRLDEGSADHDAEDVVDADELHSDSLFSSALNELRRIKDSLHLSERERVEKVHIYLARVFALSMEGKRNPVRHKALLLRTQIKFRSDTPHHKQTLRAMQKELGEKPPKGSEHEWSVALEAMEDAKINEDEESVRIFLTEPADISGKTVRGFEKARAVIKASKKLNGDKEISRMQKEAEKQSILDQKITTAEQRPLGGVETAQHVELPEDLWVSVNRGSDVLLRLRVPRKSLEDWVGRYGEPS